MTNVVAQVEKAWWKKKTFWGIIMAAAGYVCSQVPQIPNIVTILLEAVGTATGAYGITEIQRAKTAAAQKLLLK
jgi:hypothetical protein